MLNSDPACETVLVEGGGCLPFVSTAAALALPMPPKPNRGGAQRRRPAPSSLEQAPPPNEAKAAPPTADQALGLEAEAMLPPAGTPPPLEARTDAPAAAGGDAAGDVAAFATDSEGGMWPVALSSGSPNAGQAQDGSIVTEPEPQLEDAGSQQETSVSKTPRPPPSRPAAHPQPIQSPQPAYTPALAGGQLPEQFMDVDQVGAPSLTELRIVVLRWEKGKDANGSGKEHVVYVLEVTAAGRRYKIRRRWSQISSFHAQLKRLNSDLGKAERYKVKFYEKWSSTLDPGQLDGRKAELVTYFKGVTEWAMGPLKRASKPIDLLFVPQVSQFLTSDPALGDGPGLRVSGSGFGSARLAGPVSEVSPTPSIVSEGVPPTATEFEVIARFDEPGIMGFDFDRETLQVGKLQGPAEEVPHAVVSMHQNFEV